VGLAGVRFSTLLVMATLQYSSGFTNTLVFLLEWKRGWIMPLEGGIVRWIYENKVVRGTKKL